MNTKLSSKGQIVIPKAIRDAQGWAAGADLVVEARGGEVVLRRAQPEKKYTIADLKGILNYYGPPKTVDEMNADLDRYFATEWRKNNGM